MTSTELGYLSGVTSNIQTQLDGKANSGHDHEIWTVSNAKSYYYQNIMVNSNNCIGYLDAEENLLGWFGINTNSISNPTNKFFISYSNSGEILTLPGISKSNNSLISEENITFQQTGYINLDSSQSPTYPIIGAYVWGSVFSLTRRSSDGSYQNELIGFNTENGAIILPIEKNTGCYGSSYPNNPVKGQLFLLKV